MKCDPNLYRAATPSLAVKPRLIRHLFLPPLIITAEELGTFTAALPGLLDTVLANATEGA